MNYYQFFISNWKILLFAIVFTFFSGFGQTFLLSLYIPSFLKEFDINHTIYSTLYAAATLLSGFTIIFAGKIIDRVNLKVFAFVVIAGIALANLFASLVFNLFTLFIAIFLLRFFGQGLLSHTSMTAMGRYFSKARGKALSVAYLGFPLAEAIFPIAIITTISVIGWRQSFQASAMAIVAILLPLSYILLRNFSRKNVKEDFSIDENNKLPEDNTNQKVWKQKEIIRTSIFYILAPTVFITGFMLTALFFFQTFIAEDKGWSVEWMALNITAYAICSFVFSLIAGPLTDKYTARRVYPFVLLPMALGLTFLVLFSSPIITTLFWSFLGISAGLNPTVSNAIYAEEYGTLSLGGVRSLFTFVMVASTAFGPIVYSLLLDSGLTFHSIHLLIIAVIAINTSMLLLSLKHKKVQVSE
ncbi:MAG: MFS transporter [Bacteroidales bacterium]